MIEMRDVTFVYPGGASGLRMPRLHVDAGATVALIGPSGCGKTTLLYLLAGILAPRTGVIRVADVELSAQSDAARRDFRISRIGMIFQAFELLEYLTVRENILLPYRVNRSLRMDGDVRASVEALAESVGIAEALDRYPDHLSQGERQRVAVSRALITRPPLIFADEPTGNLDPRISRATVQLILDQARARGATVLMVTHDYSLLDRFDRVVDFEQLLVADADGEGDR